MRRTLSRDRSAQASGGTGLCPLQTAPEAARAINSRPSRGRGHRRRGGHGIALALRKSKANWHAGSPPTSHKASELMAGTRRPRSTSSRRSSACHGRCLSANRSITRTPSSAAIYLMQVNRRQLPGAPGVRRGCGARRGDNSYVLHARRAATAGYGTCNSGRRSRCRRRGKHVRRLRRYASPSCRRAPHGGRAMVSATTVMTSNMAGADAAMASRFLVVVGATIAANGGYCGISTRTMRCVSPAPNNIPFSLAPLSTIDLKHGRRRGTCIET